MKISKLDNTVLAAENLINSAKLLSELKSYDQLVGKLFDVAEFLLKEYEKNSHPSSEIEDLMKEIIQIDEDI